jgi:luciferase family oxidoreductase group 1
MAMMDRRGVALDLQGHGYHLRATPAAASSPPVWLLGSSDYSARLAAQLGLPYVFAHHFSGQGTAEALELYRSGFQPSEYADRPVTFLTANVCVAETAEEAQRLARPQELAMVRLRTGGPLAPQATVEEAADVTLPPEHEALATAMRERWVIGTPAEARSRLLALADELDVDEVMVNPVAGSYAAEDPSHSVGRERTLELLALR